MPLLIAILLGLSALLIVIYPLLGLDAAASTSAAGNDALADVAERERSAKMALREVDFDYRLGNLEENDYEALRSRYEGRALAALRTRYEREQALDRLIDEQLAALQDKKIGKNGNLTSAASLSGENRVDAGAAGHTSAKQNANSGKNGNPSASPSPRREKRLGGEVNPKRASGPTRSRRGKGA